jgi:molybdopterin-guanine dinucleotide biosynthesis protein A
VSTPLARGVVLVGGASRRFGADKAVWPLDGVPLALRVARTLADAGLSVVLVGRHRRGLPIPERIEPPGPRHPLWGVAEALRDGDVFVAPCDAAGLRADQVRALVAAGARAAASPLVGVFRAADRDSVVQIALAGAPARALAGPLLDVGTISNLNRPPARPPSPTA